MLSKRRSQTTRQRAIEEASGELPWELERQALRSLARLDLGGCREALAALTRSLENGGGTHEREEALFLFGILAQIQRYLSRAPAEGEDGDTTRGEMLRALARAPDAPTLRRLFHEHVDALLQPYERGSSALNPVVEKARSFIQENYNRKLSLQQIASHVSVSRNYLSTLFRKQCGCTITEFTHRVRMKRAELLLLAGGHTISEVAYKVGYQNYRDFYRNFVKYAKSSPKRFRQSLGHIRRPAGGDPSAGPLDREAAYQRS